MAEVQMKQPWSMQVITEEQLKDLNDGKLVGSEVGATLPGITDENLLSYLMDLTLAVSFGSLQVKKFPEGVKAADISLESVDANFPEVLWLCWTQFEAIVSKDKDQKDAKEPKPKSDSPEIIEAKSKARERLVKLAQHLINHEKMVSKDRLKEVLDPELQAEIGLVPTVVALRNRDVKANTKMSYTQIKFNLLRESSEGYCKLLNLLFGSSQDWKNGGNEVVAIVDKTIEKEIKAIVGAFDLDPFRVLDLILEAFQQNIQASIYLALSKSFASALISNAIGFRFQQVHKIGKGTPKSLCLVAAELIKDGQTSLEAVLGHCEPSNDDLRVLAKDAGAKLSKAVRQIGVVSLSASNELGPDGSKRANRGNDRRDEVMKPLKAENMDIDSQKLVSSAISGIPAVSQQMSLLEGLLERGDWPTAKKLCHHLEALGIKPMQHRSIGKVLCKRISTIVRPMAKNLLPNGLRSPSVVDEDPPTTVPQEFSEELLEMLDVLDIYLYHDQALWSQLCQILRHNIKYYKYQQKTLSISERIQEKLVWAEGFFLNSLLPAASLLPPSSAIINQIWAILNLYPYNMRANFYEAWQASLTDNVITQAAAKMASLEAKRILRRLHVSGNEESLKDTNKHFSRLLAKLVHIAPFSVLNTIIAQVESYANLTDPILEAMKLLTDLAFDILTFLLVERLNKDKRPRLKMDGVNTADWLKALSGLVAGSCRKYYTAMQLKILCQTVIQKLKSHSTYEMIILSDLIKAMTGIEAVSNISEGQVEACAGGPILRREVIYFSLQKKYPKRGLEILVKAIEQGALTGSDHLLVILNGVREDLQSTSLPSTFDAKAKDIKYLANRIDECNTLLLQVLDLFKTAWTTPEQYEEFIPSLSDLVQNFNVSPQLALTIHRPLLKNLVPYPPTKPKIDPNSEDGEIPEEKEDEAQAENDQGKADSVNLDPEKAAREAEKAAQEAEKEKKEQEAWNKAVQNVESIFPPETWTYFEPEMMLTFWLLSYSDIHYPGSRYAKEEKQIIDEINAKQQQVENAKQNALHARYMTEENRRRGIDEVVMAPDNLDIPATEHEIERLKVVKGQLPLEAKMQAAHVKEVNKRLLKLKDIMAKGGKCSTRGFIHLCLIPRLQRSAEDAMFCARFIQCMHEIDMPGFQTLNVVKGSFEGLTPYLSIATDLEALNIGIFINGLLNLINRWTIPAVFQAESEPRYGFRMNVKINKAIPYIKFKMFAFTSVSNMLIEIRAHMDSGDYMRIKNALDVVSRNIKVLPSHVSQAEQLKNAAWKIVQRGEEGLEKRDDIRNRARNYHSLISAEMRIPKRFLDSPQPSKTRAKANDAKKVGSKKGEAAKNGEAKGKDTKTSQSLNDTGKQALSTTGQANGVLKTGPVPKTNANSNPKNPPVTKPANQATNGKANNPGKPNAEAGVKRQRDAEVQDLSQSKKKDPNGVGSALRADAPEFKPSTTATRDPKRLKVEHPVADSKPSSQQTAKEQKVSQGDKGSTATQKAPATGQSRSTRTSPETRPVRQDQSKGDAQKEPLNATKEDKGSEASKNVLNLEKPAVTGLPTSDAKQGTAQIKASRVKRDTDNVQKDKLDQKPPLGPKIAVQKAPSSIVQDNARGKSPNQGPSVDGKALEKLAKKKESSNNEVSRSPSRKRERESGQGEGKKEETPEKKRRSSPKDVDSPQELKPEKKLSKKHSKSSKHKDSNKVAKSVDPELAKQDLKELDSKSSKRGNSKSMKSTIQETSKGDLDKKNTAEAQKLREVALKGFNQKSSAPTSKELSPVNPTVKPTSPQKVAPIVKPEPIKQSLPPSKPLPATESENLVKQSPPRQVAPAPKLNAPAESEASPQPAQRTPERPATRRARAGTILFNNAIGDLTKVRVPVHERLGRKAQAQNTAEPELSGPKRPLNTTQPIKEEIKEEPDSPPRKKRTLIKSPEPDEISQAFSSGSKPARDKDKKKDKKSKKEKKHKKDKKK